MLKGLIFHVCNPAMRSFDMFRSSTSETYAFNPSYERCRWRDGLVSHYRMLDDVILGWELVLPGLVLDIWVHLAPNTLSRFP